MPFCKVIGEDVRDMCPVGVYVKSRGVREGLEGKGGWSSVQHAFGETRDATRSTKVIMSLRIEPEGS